MAILLSEAKEKTKKTTILMKSRAYNVTTVDIIALTGLIPHYSSNSLYAFGFPHFH